MTFDEWSYEITARVFAELPGVRVKRKVDELCRWIRDGKECQVHALSDSVAAFVALQRNGIMTDCSFSCNFAMTDDSKEEVVSRILGWLAAAP
jgi:hypothetical protein